MECTFLHQPLTFTLTSQEEHPQGIIASKQMSRTGKNNKETRTTLSPFATEQVGLAACRSWSAHSITGRGAGGKYRVAGRGGGTNICRRRQLFLCIQILGQGWSMNTAGTFASSGTGSSLTTLAPLSRFPPFSSPHSLAAPFPAMLRDSEEE